MRVSGLSRAVPVEGTAWLATGLAPLEFEYVKERKTCHE
jgi:hypothetical protein